MRPFSIVWALILAASLGTAALAANTTVKLTLDGRPVAGNGVVALNHNGVVYADMILLNKTFSGLMSIKGKTYSTVVRGHAVAFTANSPIGVFQGRKVRLPARPFLLNNSLYVPLAAFARGIGVVVRINPSHTAADIIAPS
jgi:hypothetical protein